MVYFLKELHHLSVACANVLLTRSFVNLGIETSVLELELESELILQTSLFPVP